MAAQAAETPVQTSVPVNPPVPVAAEIKPARLFSLHVSDLAPTVTESDLYDFFRQASNGSNAVQSIRVCRDSATGQSLRYAYVNFSDEDTGRRAMEVANFENIQGRPCRISVSRRDPSARKAGVGNLFVKNLPQGEDSIDHAGLHEVFQNFGKILSVKVSMDNEGKSRGYGFVHFADEKDAENAKNTMNGKCVNSQEITVLDFIPRANRPSNNSYSESTFDNIYLKHMNRDLTSEKYNDLLKTATEDIAEISSPKLMTTTKDNGEEVSRGFGFCSFKTHEGAVKALERFRDIEKMKELVPEFLGEQPLYAAIAIPKSARNVQRAPDRNLYTKCFPDEYDDQRLKELFGNFGEIESAKVMRNENGSSKGFGFVCFRTAGDARRASEELNGSPLEGKRLYVSFAQSKAERAQALAAQHNRMMMPGVPYNGFPGPIRTQGPYPGARQYVSPAGRPGAGPRGMQAPYPPMMRQPAMQPISGGDLRMNLESIQEPTARTQFLGDQIYQILRGELGDEFKARQMTGIILTSVNRELEQPERIIPELISIIENPEKRQLKVQHFMQSLSAAPPQPQAQPQGQA